MKQRMTWAEVIDADLSNMEKIARSGDTGKLANAMSHYEKKRAMLMRMRGKECPYFRTDTNEVNHD